MTMNKSGITRRFYRWLDLIYGRENQPHYYGPLRAAWFEAFRQGVAYGQSHAPQQDTAPDAEVVPVLEDHDYNLEYVDPHTIRLTRRR